MDNDKIKERILEILDLFGMTGTKAAEIMGVKASTFNCKKMIITLAIGLIKKP
ncbi:hypothetical protein LEQ03_12955 [Riemerella anatipestifer]|nr:hypothetical protein LEQ03_12955 [Riemerella anatipestifer]